MDMRQCLGHNREATIMSCRLCNVEHMIRAGKGQKSIINDDNLQNQLKYQIWTDSAWYFNHTAEMLPAAGLLPFWEFHGDQNLRRIMYERVRRDQKRLVATGNVCFESLAATFDYHNNGIAYPRAKSTVIRDQERDHNVIRLQNYYFLLCAWA